MNSILKKSSEHSRGLLFGLLTNCIFSNNEKETCPLFELRNSLSIEEKYAFVMELSKEEVITLLTDHEYCFANRLAGGFIQE
jgi:hypothetical protein